MTDQKFLRRRRTVRLLKQLAELQRSHDLGSGIGTSPLSNPSPELEESLRLLS